MLLNLCLLIACAFLLSLTYREWPVRRRPAEHVLRVVLAAGAALLLTVYSVPLGQFRFDLRLVPVALVALRYGLGSGVLVLLPAVGWRLLEDRVGGGVAVLNGLSVLLLSGVLRPHLRLMQVGWRQLWMAPLPFLGLGLAMLLSPQGRVYALPLYLLGVLLNALGLVVALAVLRGRLRLLRLTHVLRTQAHTDALTGLGNRRQFDEDLAALDVGNQLVLLDVDHFKTVNDLYGHDAGDRVLEQIARLLAEQPHLRAYRVGGEEFALLADTGSADRTRALVEKLRRQPLQVGPGEGSPLTLSAGMTTRRPDDTPSSLFRRADEALYLAKTNGRDRLVVWQAPVPGGSPEARDSQIAPVPLQPRYSLWQALRTTVALLAERRAYTDDDWRELLRLAVAAVDGAQAGSLDLREGQTFRLCAVEGHSPQLEGARLPPVTQQRWYARSVEEWRAGAARVLRGGELRLAAAHANEWLEPEVARQFEESETDRIRANLCVPVVLGGEVVAHLNLDAFSSEDAFTLQSVETAGLFAQQFAALFQLQERWRELDLLSQLHVGIGSDPDGTEAEAQLAATAIALLRADQATLLRYDAQADRLVSVAVEGADALRPMSLPRGQGLSWEALARGRVVRVTGTCRATRLSRQRELEGDAMMAVPLLDTQHEPLGVLVLTREAERPFLADDESLGLLLGSVATRLLERSSHLAALRATLDAALTTLGAALETRDFETQGHTARVSRYAERFAQFLGLSGERLTALRHGAALHDIGKLGMPDAVLLKPGTLTPEERLKVEDHVALGARLAARIPFLHPEAHSVIRSHHERWDGLGYPDALCGEDIPLLARLFALCDVYDALVSTRPYKRAMPPEQALEILRAGRGTQFDPELTDLFTRLWHAGEFR